MFYATCFYCGQLLTEGNEFSYCPGRTATSNSNSHVWGYLSISNDDDYNYNPAKSVFPSIRGGTY
jgi:hypothetical protein